MTMEIMYGVIIFVSLMVWIIGFAIVVMLDSYTDKKRKRFFAIMIALILSLVLQNYFEYYLIAYHENIMLRTGVAIYGYIVRPAIIVMFAHLVAPKKRHIIAWCLVGINGILHLTAFFSPIVFWINDANGYQGGPLNSVCLIVSIALLFYMVYLVIFRFKMAQLKEFIFHMFWILVIVAGIITDVFLNTKDQWVDYVTIAVVGVSAFTYIWLHQRFVHDAHASFVAEQRIRVIRSQVQPHFIYNTLSSIRNIEGNPEETKRAITEFANYIRGNLSALNGKELIPFKTEMEYVKDYISLQQRRFPNKINAVYDIQDEYFSLPPLTIQILVENAIKHGIAERYEEGTIIIRSRRENRFHLISVIDDGVGFDPRILETSDRVGMRAVKNRLEFYLEGSMLVKSEPGKGTEVTIKIPCSPAATESNFSDFIAKFRRKKK